MSKCKIVTICDYGNLYVTEDIDLTERRKLIIQHIYDNHNVINVINYRGDMFFITEE